MEIEIRKEINIKLTIDEAIKLSSDLGDLDPARITKETKNFVKQVKTMATIANKLPGD